MGAISFFEEVPPAVLNHHELKVGTLGGVLKQAGVSPEEFIKILRV